MSMRSGICDDCGLMFAYYAINVCYVSWVNREGEPELKEEQVLGGSRTPCKPCEEKLVSILEAEGTTVQGNFNELNQV